MLKTSLLTTLSALLLISCATSPKGAEELAQSQHYFENGYYKRAFRELLPLASKGNPQAEYAIGYMYYYGYGTAQDVETGAFWIQKSASEQYAPAIQAITLLKKPVPAK